MSHTISEVPLKVHRIEGDGPMGFSVMDLETLGAKSQEDAKTKAGEIARRITWVKVQDLVGLSSLDHQTVFGMLGRLGPLTESFLLMEDGNEDAIGGYFLIGDIWHRGRVRDALAATGAGETYTSLSLALIFLAEARKIRRALNVQKSVR